MPPLWRWLPLACAIATCAPSRGLAQQPPSLRRFALLVGANHGGEERATLRYAGVDARQVASVLQELGGVEVADAEVVEEPSYSQLEGKLRALGERLAQVRARGQRTELVFYYSGHSDEQGLRIGEDLVPYPVLRKWLSEVPADVRIAVLDSCASGALTRLKGGTRRAPFVFDASTRVKGHAFLTSSSENEAAQESDRVGGSFFTHYFVSGLRGAADTSGDGKVTLTEAYRFAFDETLARTGGTQGGAQHPAYDLQLVGSGDLVMTDLRTTSALLRIANDVEGRLFIHDGQQRLVAELYKPAGRGMELGVPPGRYTLRLYEGQSRYLATVQIAEGKGSTVQRSDFVRTESELTASRGDQAVEIKPVTAEIYDLGGTGDRPVRTYMGFNLLYGAVEQLQGMQLGFLANGVLQSGRGLQLSLVYNKSRGNFQGVQLTVAANHGDVFRGFQASTAYNLSRELSGAQVSVGLNLALEHSRGWQVAGVNWATDLSGVQTGLLNTANNLRGLQVGMVNIASGRVNGVQLGLINYADEAKGAVGLVSATRKGGVKAELAMSTLALINVGMRLSAERTYTILSVGVHPLAGEEHIMFGGGLGVNIPLREPVSLDLDAMAQFVFQDYELKVADHPNVTVVQLRLQARWQILRHLTIVAGPTMNFVMAQPGAEDVIPGFDLGGRVYRSADDGNQLKLTPGVTLGMLL